MSEEVQNRLRVIKKRQTSQTFMNSFLLVGMVALAAAVAILFTANDREVQAIKVVVTEAQDALKVTCSIAEGQQPLSGSTKDTCDTAQRNELPQRVAEAIDDPDPNDPESQDPEIQDPELQDPEISDSETNDPDPDDPEVQDEEVQDEEVQDEEVQEAELQEPEIQEPEEQNAPVCSEGFSQQPFVYDPTPDVPDSDDERVWMLCMENQ